MAHLYDEEIQLVVIFNAAVVIGVFRWYWVGVSFVHVALNWSSQSSSHSSPTFNPHYQWSQFSRYDIITIILSFLFNILIIRWEIGSVSLDRFSEINKKEYFTLNWSMFSPMHQMNIEFNHLKRINIEWQPLIGNMRWITRSLGRNCHTNQARCFSIADHIQYSIFAFW